jgi:hypothetical protein
LTDRQAPNPQLELPTVFKHNLESFHDDSIANACKTAEYKKQTCAHFHQLALASTDDMGGNCTLHVRRREEGRDLLLEPGPGRGRDRPAGGRYEVDRQRVRMVNARTD